MANDDPERLAELALQVKQTLSAGKGDWPPPASGDDVLSELIEALRGHIAVSVRRLVSSQDAEDVTQEALERIFRRLRSWDPDRGSFLTWAITVARNVARDHLRRRQRSGGELLQAEVVEATDAAPYLAQIDDAALIRSLHEELRTRQDVVGRRALVAARDLAHQGQNLSVAAIAREADLDESTIRRALLRVRRLLGELEKS